MLMLGTYTKHEMTEFLGTHNRQDINRKLRRYDVKFKCSGRGENVVYEIQEIKNPFKLYAILELHIPAQSDFTKIRNLYYYLFYDEDFVTLPVLEMAQRLDEDHRYISRQTIARWIEHLQEIDYILLDRSDCYYYAITTSDDGKKNPNPITKELYKEGWALYWNEKEETNDTKTAYWKMYHFIGGHPYKRPKIILNGIYADKIEQLMEIVHEAFTQEVSQNK